MVINNKQNLEALLQYQIDLGADEAICPLTFNRFVESKIESLNKTPQTQTAPAKNSMEPNIISEKEAAAIPPSESIDKVAVVRAKSLISNVKSLDDLRRSIKSFEFCDYKATANNLVFSDGNPSAKIMLVGEAPGQEEDLKGKPFVGRSGQLLDKIFLAAGFSRNNPEPLKSLYITNSVNWRPPGNQTPPKTVVEMFRPFIEKHIELINPQILVLTGNSSCSAILNQVGITKLRGKWIQMNNRWIMPILHPAFLLRDPRQKQLTWYDIIKIKRKVTELNP